MHPAKGHATYEDVLRAPESMVAELIGGELFLQPRPALKLAEAATVLAMVLGAPFRLGRGGPGGWVLQFEPELHLGADVLVPDLAGWRRALHPDLDLALAFTAVPPDWVCEVLSAATQGRDRVRKLPLYGEHGVQYAWLVDPMARTLEVYKRREGAWIVHSSHEGSATVRAEPFDAVAFELDDLWVP
jgi:hypothetical protein